MSFRTGSTRVLLLCIFGFIGIGGAPPTATAAAPRLPQGTASSPSTASADTLDAYADRATYELIERARRIRTLEESDLVSYEATMWERIYAGVDAFRFRRERALFEQERSARVRWSRDGERVVAWEAARREVLAGSGTASLHSNLARGGVPAPLQHVPGDDRLVFGDQWALHPLSDSAAHHYRFAPGDTIRLNLTTPEREVRLVEVRVEPRRSDFRLISGSLWFDDSGGALTRVAYRPARAFDMSLDASDDAGDVPVLLRPIRAEIRHITVDYGLHELRWWLPRRYVFEGEVQVGMMARFPVVFEWTLRGYRVNEEDAISPTGALPEGWARTDREVERDDEPPLRVSVLVPPADSLLGSAVRLPPAAGRVPRAIPPEEIDEITRDLGRNLPSLPLPRPTVEWGFVQGLTRYNRVEGPSTAARLRLPVTGHSEIQVKPRVSAGTPIAGGEVTYRHTGPGSETRVSLHHRLAHTSDWLDPWGLSASLSAFVFGVDQAEFYRTTGGVAERTWQGRSGQASLGLFREEHRTAPTRTRFHLLRPVTGVRLGENLEADSGTWTGVRGTFRWQSGVDAGRPLLFASWRGEAAGEGPAYGRSIAAVGLSAPVRGRVTGALEVVAGGTWGDPPPQRLLYAGGPGTLRGFGSGSLVGEGLWVVRGELGTGERGVRAALFMDAGQVGSRGELLRAPRFMSAGTGLSLMEGLLRVDFAVPIRGGNGYRIQAYLDGLL